MPESSIANLPEVFVSHTAISNAVHQAVARGQLRKLATRLYTRNQDEDPTRLILRNWYYLLPSYYPDALIADRTALENRPATDGSVFLISAKKRDTALPGLTFRPRPGPGALHSDRPFIGGARLSSTARAYLENMRGSRARDGRVARTLSRGEIEGCIDTLIRQQGEAAANRLRDEREPSPHNWVLRKSSKLSAPLWARCSVRELSRCTHPPARLGPQEIPSILTGLTCSRRYS
jgi:hypothetical protein